MTNRNNKMKKKKRSSSRKTKRLLKQKRPANRKRERGGVTKEIHTKSCPKDINMCWYTSLCHWLQFSDSHEDRDILQA